MYGRTILKKNKFLANRGPNRNTLRTKKTITKHTIRNTVSKIYANKR